jgi:hypothetical protein
VLQYLQKLLSISKLADFIVDHQDKIQQWAPGVGLVMTWLFSAWTWLSGQPPVVITAVAITIFAATLVILTEIPQWLERYKPRPFAVQADFLFVSLSHLNFVAEIFNRSKHERIELEFSIHLQAEGKPATRFLSIDEHNIRRNLGPQQSTRGFFSVSLSGTGYNQDVHFETHLRVIDRLSGRWVIFKIPGQFPPDFFHSPTAMP